MSRCEHGQMISIYCLNESCTWREAGGCQNCFKRYHSHPANIGTVTQDKLDELYRRMIVRPDPKPKSRILQEAVFNYFIIMKSQLASSLDTVSRAITNRLNYPYLTHARQLQIFSKIKNKEYKKINKKQLKLFCEFANQNSKEQLEENQRTIYSEEVVDLRQKIKKINEAFIFYSTAIQDLDNSFVVESTFVDKINEIVSSIEAALKEGKVNTRQGSDTSSKSTDKRAEEVKIDNQLLRKPPIPNSRDRDRKISFDVTSDLSKFQANFENKNIENEINERKKRLLQMDQPYGRAIDQIKVDLTPAGVNQELKVKQKQKLVDRSAEKHLPRDFSADKGYLRPQKDGRRINNKQNSDTEVDPRSQIMHTILPREASRPKLYEYSKDVKQKKFTVPVKIAQEKAECPSPILKKKKTLVQKGLTLFKVESISNQQRQAELEEVMETKIPEIIAEEKKIEPEANLLLRQKQTDSLALLIASLSASAQQAIPFLEASIKYAHNNLSAAEYLSYLYLEIGKPKESLTVCNQFLQQIQDSPEAGELSQHLVNNKAAALNMLGRYSESISILEKCIQKNERDIYYKNLGDAYFSIGIHEKAAINYEKAVKMNPDMDEALFNLAVCLYVQGHFMQAQLNAQKALKLNMKNEQYQELNKQIAQKLNV